jgi:hypothetical protein
MNETFKKGPRRHNLGIDAMIILKRALDVRWILLAQCKVTLWLL